MAPEYALWGYLTYKADVYSFGIVALEIVSGKHNNNYIPSNGCLCLLDWVLTNFLYIGVNNQSGCVFQLKGYNEHLHDGS